MANKKGRKRRPQLSQIKKKAFLGAFAVCGTITRAAKESGIDRRTHQRWMEDDKAYAESFAEAAEQAADHLEDEARRRAHEGLVRLKFHQGEPIIDPRTLPGCELFDKEYPQGKPYFEHEYSDTLLIFLLKGARPKKFRENLDITSDDKPVVVKVLSGVSMEDL